jgi:hypothetical protein
VPKSSPVPFDLALYPITRNLSLAAGAIAIVPTAARLPLQDCPRDSNSVEVYRCLGNRKDRPTIDPKKL